MNFYRVGQEIISMKLKLLAWDGDCNKLDRDLLEDGYFDKVEYYLNQCKIYQELPCEKVMAIVNI